MSNAIKVIPLRGYVIIDREKERVSPAGIIMADAVKDKSSRGVVVAVGDGIVLMNGNLREPKVRVGDTILFKAFTCKMNHNGSEYLVLSEDDIMCILPDANDSVRTYA